MSNTLPSLTFLFPVGIHSTPIFSAQYSSEYGFIYPVKLTWACFAFTVVPDLGGKPLMYIGNGADEMENAL